MASMAIPADGTTESPIQYDKHGFQRGSTASKLKANYPEFTAEHVLALLGGFYVVRTNFVTGTDLRRDGSRASTTDKFGADPQTRFDKLTDAARVYAMSTDGNKRIGWVKVNNFGHGGVISMTEVPKHYVESALAGDAEAGVNFLLAR